MKSYYRKKAEYAKKLYDKGLPFVKVYATVREGEDFIVLKREKEGKISYQLAGGGVDEKEDLTTAVKRELLEELNAVVEVVSELGVYNDLVVPYELDGEKFSVRYEIHVFDTKLIRFKRGRLGLKGEFDKRTDIARIDKNTLLNTVAEFCEFNIKLD